MIVATAGHVDHGKTSLVRCLTGVDTDRMDEEKRRGLSINLGYAYLPNEHGLPLGFIDVPGHKRFINNMICGISGIDMGLLLVAADDGVMPQTLEHLEVLALLGVEKLAIVISKIDRVSAKRVDDVGAQVQELCAARGWHAPPLFAVSSTAGTGIDALKYYLLSASEAAACATVAGCFRMSIDRAFTIKGTGLVVTGTIAAGSTQLDDMLRLTPDDRKVRVRGLRVHDAQTTSAQAGQRCAINLSGDVALEDVTRGDRLVGLQAGPASDRIDVYVSLLESLGFPLKHMGALKLHIGASRIAARIALLDPAAMGNRLQPGQQALAQLILERPIASSRLERFVLRDDSGEVLLGGGRILDPHGMKPSRSRQDYVAHVQAMATEETGAALQAWLALEKPVNLTHFEWSCNLLPGESTEYLADDVRTYKAGDTQWAVARTQWQTTASDIIQCLSEFHTQNPDQTGMQAAALARTLQRKYATHLLRAVLSQELKEQRIMLRDGLLHLPSFAPQSIPEIDKAWQQVASLIAASGNNIMLMSELLEQTGMSQKKLQRLLQNAVRQKRAHQVSDRRYALPAQLTKLSTELADFAATGEEITVKALKSHWGTGRNITVEILEYFDRVRFTQRKDNARVILDNELPARLYAG